MARRTLGGTRHHREIGDFGIGYSWLSYLGSIFGNGLAIIPRFSQNPSRSDRLAQVPDVPGAATGASTVAACPDCKSYRTALGERCRGRP
jgi:hypothetical protein